MRRRARLPSDFGIDPETQNLCDGAWKWPTLRQTLLYNSPERRLERAIVRKLLDSPEASVIELNPGDLEAVLGPGWMETLQEIVPVGLRKVGHLVCESCVAVSIRLLGSKIIVRVIL